MTLQEIREAINSGLIVCWSNSGHVVTLEQVCPLHDLSVISKRNNYITALQPNEYDDCFILGA